MLKISEVYQKQIKVFQERPDGSEYVNFTKTFAARDCLINPDYVVAVHPHEFTSDLDLKEVEKSFPVGTKFSLFVLDGNSFRSSEIIVVGSFDRFCSLLEAGNK